MSTFHYQHSNTSTDATPLVVEVPAGIDSPQLLFEELAKRLQFPGYFGMNWNALEECLRDLSWLPRSPILLMHRDLPIAGDTESQKIYLSILRDAIEKRSLVRGEELRDYVVFFPNTCQQQVVSLLQEIDEEEATRETNYTWDL